MAPAHTSDNKIGRPRMFLKKKKTNFVQQERMNLYFFSVLTSIQDNLNKHSSTDHLAKAV